MLSTVLDYETLATDYGPMFDADSGKFQVLVQVTDSKPTTISATMDVTVIDVNEPPRLRDASSKPVVITVSEAGQVGTVIATLPVDDPDDQVRLLSFTTVQVDEGAAVIVTVELVGYTGGRNAVIKLAPGATLDYEDQAEYVW